MSDDKLGLYRQTLLTKRVSLALKEESKMRRGTWFYQYYEPTCTVWAVANGMFTLGVQPNGEFMEEARNIAVGVTNPTRRGLVTNEAAKLLRKFHTELELQPPPKRLYRTSSRHKLRKNADLIRSIIDRGEVLIASVASDRYYNRSPEGNKTHALCIVGYRVTKNRWMDIQLIDSNFGYIWTSLEYLSRTFVAKREHVMRRK